MDKNPDNFSKSRGRGRGRGKWRGRGNYHGSKGDGRTDEERVLHRCTSMDQLRLCEERSKGQSLEESLQLLALEARRQRRLEAGRREATVDTLECRLAALERKVLEGEALRLRIERLEEAQHRMEGEAQRRMETLEIRMTSLEASVSRAVESTLPRVEALLATVTPTTPQRTDLHPNTPTVSVAPLISKSTTNSARDDSSVRSPSPPSPRKLTYKTVTSASTTTTRPTSSSAPNEPTVHSSASPKSTLNTVTYAFSETAPIPYPTLCSDNPVTSTVSSTPTAASKTSSATSVSIPVIRRVHTPISSSDYTVPEPINSACANTNKTFGEERRPDLEHVFTFVFIPWPSLLPSPSSSSSRSSLSTTPPPTTSSQAPTHLSDLLYEAAACGDLAALDTLLAAGARTEDVDSNGYSALHIAAFYGNQPVVNALLHNGADPECRDAKHRTPLHIACALGDENCVRHLVQAGALVNACTKEGWTPLHMAACGGHGGCMAVLEAGGADGTAKDAKGRTPSEFARTAVLSFSPNATSTE